MGFCWGGCPEWGAERHKLARLYLVWQAWEGRQSSYKVLPRSAYWWKSCKMGWTTFLDWRKSHSLVLLLTQVLSPDNTDFFLRLFCSLCPPCGQDSFCRWQRGASTEPGILPCQSLTCWHCSCVGSSSAAAGGPGCSCAAGTPRELVHPRVLKRSLIR